MGQGHNSDSLSTGAAWPTEYQHIFSLFQISSTCSIFYFFFPHTIIVYCCSPYFECSKLYLSNSWMEAAVHSVWDVPDMVLLHSKPKAINMIPKNGPSITISKYLEMYLNIVSYKVIQHGNVPYGPTRPCHPSSIWPCSAHIHPNLSYLFSFPNVFAILSFYLPQLFFFSGNSFHITTTLCVGKIHTKLFPFTLNLCLLVLDSTILGINTLCIHRI